VTYRLSKRQFLVGAAASLAAPYVRAGGPIELRMSWWGGSDIHKAQLAALRRFEARYPNIHIHAEYTS